MISVLSVLSVLRETPRTSCMAMFSVGTIISSTPTQLKMLVSFRRFVRLRQAR
jgi:hypothetical protein